MLKLFIVVNVDKYTLLGLFYDFVENLFTAQLLTRPFYAEKQVFKLTLN
jgi:hypothetical protein